MKTKKRFKLVFFWANIEFYERETRFNAASKIQFY